MPELPQQWNLPRPYGRDQAQAAQLRAAAAVLDALIQANAKVSIRAIEVAAESFPAQATILITRLPLSESRVTLEAWTLEGTGSWRRQTLARIASMMLAKDPGQSQGGWRPEVMGFVASVVAASESELQITISSKASGRVVGGTSSCGDSFGHDLYPGWPQVYTYDLVENYQDASAPIIIDLDGDRIAYRRFEENRPWGSCFGVQGLDPSTRHRLIAHWLGVSDDAVPWQAVEPFDIVWTNKAAYERELGAIVESQRTKLRATVRALHKRGFLTKAEAASVAPKNHGHCRVRDQTVPAQLILRSRSILGRRNSRG
jgi:hypothetical protein